MRLPRSLNLSAGTLLLLRFRVVWSDAFMKNVILGVLALTIATSHSELFDNEAQLQARYGIPVEITGDSRLYRWGELYVVVQIEDIGQGFKVSVREAYKREDSGQLTASDIEKCLPSPSSGGKWMKRSDTTWQMGGRPIVASLVEQDNMIVVRSVK